MKKGWLLKLIKKPLVKGLLGSIPFVGDVVDNVLTETENSPAGKLDPKDMIVRLVRLAVLLALIALAIGGKISFDDADRAKEFITQ